MTLAQAIIYISMAIMMILIITLYKRNKSLLQENYKLSEEIYKLQIFNGVWKKICSDLNEEHNTLIKNNELLRKKENKNETSSRNEAI